MRTSSPLSPRHAPETPSRSQGAGISIAKWAAFDDLVKLANLDRRPTGDDGLAPPRQRLVQVGGVQYPKTANVLLGLEVRPVGDEHRTTRLRPQRLRVACRMQAAGEKPGTSSDHLFVEHVDIAAHRFVLCDERVVVVGMVNRNQKLSHDLSSKVLRASRLPCLHHLVEWPKRNSTIFPRKFPAEFAFTNPKRERGLLFPAGSDLPTKHERGLLAHFEFPNGRVAGVEALRFAASPRCHNESGGVPCPTARRGHV